MTQKAQLQRAEHVPQRSLPPHSGDTDAETFYKRQLTATASPKKKANLGRVWRALEQLRKAKKRSFSFRAVAEAIAAFDIPSPTYQAMLNRGGQHFRDLIRAYALQYGSRETAGDPRDDDILAALHDPVLQMRYMNLRSLLKSMEQGERLLKQQLERQAHTTEARPQRADEFSVVCTTVDAFAVEEFLRSVDAHPLWEFETDGALAEASRLGQKSRKLAPAGFEQALRKLVDRHVL